MSGRVGKGGSKNTAAPLVFFCGCANGMHFFFFLVAPLYSNLFQLTCVPLLQAA